MKKRYIFGLGISIGTFDNIQSEIITLAKNNKSASVFLSNVHMLIEAKLDPDFEKIFNAADIVTSDGMPICFALRMLQGIKQERVAGMDLFPSLIAKAEEEGLSVFFLGSTDDVIAKIVSLCAVRHPTLNISGFYSPPFRELTKREHSALIDGINNSDTQILFVALGCPKQENFIWSLKDKVSSVMLGVGGAFPVLAGTVTRAPMWAQRSGLEWLYRFSKEPRRLFKRYFFTNTIFVFLLFGSYFKKKVTDIIGRKNQKRTTLPS